MVFSNVPLKAMADVLNALALPGFKCLGKDSGLMIKCYLFAFKAAMKPHFDILIIQCNQHFFTLLVLE